MIPREVLRKVKQIEIRTRHLVTDVFGGEYHSAFKGTGMEFSEVREYTPGDDIRAIDWNVTARTGHPFIKIFKEERELTVLFLVDQSGSTAFGTRGRSKAEVSAEVGALLALSAVQNQDRVGMIACSNQVELYVPPNKGRQHVLRVVREILFREPQGQETNLKEALDYLVRMQKRKAIVFVLSDFFDTGYQRSLAMAARKHDVVAVRVRDRWETELPKVGLVAVRDLESGRETWVDTSDPGVRRAFAWRQEDYDKEFRGALRRSGIDSIDLWTDEDVVRPLAGFFKKRLRRMAR